MEEKVVTKVYNRKIMRNKLKKIVGNNKIQKAWHYLQEHGWVSPKNKENKESEDK